jgi:hypothetical protein
MIVITRNDTEEEKSSKPIRIDTPDGAEWTTDVLPDKLTETERRRLAHYKVSFRVGGIVKRLKNSGLNAAQIAQKFKGQRGFSLSYIQKAFAALSNKKKL